MERPIADILVIDDERVICEGCRLTLEEHGHRVDISHTGKAGLASIRGKSHDLVLLDMKLPDSDGMDILKTLHREKPRVAVIVMTGYSSVENAVKAMKLGAHDYLAKPFSEDELLLAVDKALGYKRLSEENQCLGPFCRIESKCSKD